MEPPDATPLVADRLRILLIEVLTKDNDRPPAEAVANMATCAPGASTCRLLALSWLLTADWGGVDGAMGSDIDIRHSQQGS